jgi:uncharacterized Zn-binding protein involved in type VI secretion
MATPRLFLPILALLALSLSADPAAVHRRLEVARLRAHFDSVDSELRGRVGEALTPAQRTARETLIGWLREYRDAGSFPRNDRFPDRAMPFFRDSDGVLCAMAYLIDRSGRGDLVDRVASTRNNAFIPELGGDAALAGWLDSVGLSWAEAARVQPSYEHDPEPEGPGVSSSYALTSILASGVSLATVGVNALAPSRAAGWAGLLAGSAGLLVGGVEAGRDGATGDVATANLIVGAGAATFGLFRLLQPPTTFSRRVSLGPVVVPDAERPRYGLALWAAF